MVEGVDIEMEVSVVDSLDDGTEGSAGRTSGGPVAFAAMIGIARPSAPVDPTVTSSEVAGLGAGEKGIERTEGDDNSAPEA